MIAGYNHLTQPLENTWIFNATTNSISLLTGWQTWSKPNDCNMIHILAIGPGGGGGNGIVKTAGATSGGGGGGGTSGYINLTIPAYLLPDTLYIRVGTGGTAGTLPPRYSIVVATTPTSVASPWFSSLMYMDIPTGTVAGNGSAGGGVGGSAIGGLNIGPVGALGVSKITPGVAGQAGGLVANYDQTGIVGGGAGGSLSSTANVTGNSITSAYKQQSSVVVVPGTAAGVTSKSGNGYSLFNPFQAFAGAGGANNNTVAGSPGGDGGIGCGGGGGGCGLLTAGAGGLGGNALVIITCW